MSKANGKIGVFDSGFGGLMILKGIFKKLPQYDYLYLGDTARTPYGGRSKETIYQFTKQAIDFLFKNGAELIIIACNTASCEALKKIQQEYIPNAYPGKKVLGVLIPAVEEAVLETKNKRIGVIGTEATVNSLSFKKEINKRDRKIKVFQTACPLLVPLVEAGEDKGEAMDLFLKKYINPLLLNNIDTLILGCTHYEILEKNIKEICKNKVIIISEARTVPLKLEAYLNKHREIENKIGKGGKVDFYTTDLTEKFMKLGSKLYGKKIIPKKIEIN